MSKRRLCSLHDFRVAKPWDERRRRVFANRKQSRGPLLDVGHDDTSVAWSGYFRVYAKQINGEQVRRLYNMFVGYERFPRTCRDNNPFNAPPPSVHGLIRDFHTPSDTSDAVVRGPSERRRSRSLRVTVRTSNVCCTCDTSEDRRERSTGRSTTRQLKRRRTSRASEATRPGLIRLIGSRAKATPLEMRLRRCVEYVYISTSSA